MRDSIDHTISYPVPSTFGSRSFKSQSFIDEDQIKGKEKPEITKAAFFILSIRALGVVFGDIGTSPLYVLNTLFPGPPSHEELIGAGSLIIYSLFLMVCGKYIAFILAADHHNEGGIFALCSLLVKKSSPLRLPGKRAVVLWSIVGASFLLGDGCITPAISVVSAIEGIGLRDPSLKVYVVPITIVILVCLYLVQPYGTAKVGAVFGPIILLWFVSIGAVGYYNVVLEPKALYAFNPWAGISFFIARGSSSYFSLASVFLSITGMEAMFADMGHFRRGPIRLAWAVIVFPAIVGSYLGQVAYLMREPEFYKTPFYKSIPGGPGVYWYIFCLATMAGIIASQAIITGSFSITSQAIWLGFAPPFTIKQTSKKIQGQIYIPTINWTLMVLSIIIVVGFQSSSAISNVYGVDIVCNEILTSVLFIMVMHYAWKYEWWQTSFFIIFLFVDFCYFGAVMSKIGRGGWVAIIISAFFAIIMFIWYGGEYRLRRFRKVHDTSTRIELLQDRFIVDPQPQHHHYPGTESPPRLSIQSTRSDFYSENLKLKLQQKQEEMMQESRSIIIDMAKKDKPEKKEKPAKKKKAQKNPDSPSPQPEEILEEAKTPTPPTTPTTPEKKPKKKENKSSKRTS